MGLFEEAHSQHQADSDENQWMRRVADQQFSNLVKEQQILISEFIDGMIKLGITPKKHEITYGGKGSIVSGSSLSRRSFFPKKYVTGFSIRWDSVVITLDGQMYDVHLKNKDSSRDPLPLPQRDPGPEGLGYSMSGNIFRSELTDALRAHMS